MSDPGENTNNNNDNNNNPTGWTGFWKTLDEIGTKTKSFFEDSSGGKSIVHNLLDSLVEDKGKDGGDPSKKPQDGQKPKKTKIERKIDETIEDVLDLFMSNDDKREFMGTTSKTSRNDDDSSNSDDEENGKLSEIFGVILGIAQDGGYPQAGCLRNCCKNLTQKKHFVTSLAVVDRKHSRRWLFDCTPDFP
jgi:hypothetical protein